MSNINQYSPQTGRVIKEDNTTVNTGNAIVKGIDQNGNEILNQVMDATPAFSAKATITRGAVATAYSAGQIMLGSGGKILPTIDLSASTGLNLANRKIALTGAFLISNNGVNSAFNGFVDLFNISNPEAGTTLADYAAFNPTANALVNNFCSTLDSLTNTRKYGTTSNLSMQTEVLRKCTLDASGKLYFALVPTSAYTPIVNEQLTLILKFYLLN